jgi:hypothetical protein
MKRFFFSYAAAGLILGLLPVTYLIYIAAPMSGKGASVDLFALFALGIPLMTLGCYLGALWQHQGKFADSSGGHVNGSRFVNALPIGALIGGLVGMCAAVQILVFLDSDRETLLTLRDTSSLGLLFGALAGVFVAGWFAREVRPPVMMPHVQKNEKP